MVKIRGANKLKLSKKRQLHENKFINYAEIRGEFINFVGIWGNMEYASLD